MKRFLSAVALAAVMLWVPVDSSGQDARPSFCPCDQEMVDQYRRAAEGGLAAAQSRLGALYEYGEGVPWDNVLAYMWFNLAAAQGHEDAPELKNVIEEQMTRAQIAGGPTSVHRVARGASQRQLAPLRGTQPHLAA
jgi:TPR repeat protein